MSNSSEKFVKNIMDKKSDNEIKESLKRVLKEKVIERIKSVKEE